MSNVGVDRAFAVRVAAVEPFGGVRTLTDVTTSESGAELWLHVCAGDEEAFATVYRDRADAIFGFCVRRTGDWAAAQDCVSMVFLEAWRHRDRLRDGESLNAWLFGIANNVVRNVVRARRRHGEMLDRIPLETRVESVDAEVLDRLEAERAIRPMAAALGQLRRADRELIALAAWSGLSMAEIGAALGIPVGTVKSRLSRAKKRLSSAVLLVDDERLRVSVTTIGVNL